MPAARNANRRKPQINDVRDRALAMADVCAIVTVSEATLWRMRRRHEFPTPIQISPGRIGWLRSTVDQWLATRAPAA